MQLPTFGTPPFNGYGPHGRPNRMDGGRLQSFSNRADPKVAYNGDRFSAAHGNSDDPLPPGREPGNEGNNGGGNPNSQN